MTWRRPGLALLLCVVAASGAADTSRHPLWELHGRHNTVYLLGSIHTLRPEDYPLAPALLEAYADAKALLMEVDLSQLDIADVQSQMLASATLPAGTTLPQVLGRERYARAANLARGIGIELSTFDPFAPWFAAEAISQLQLTKLGFQSQAGVEMYFLARAKSDGKRVAGLETVRDQIALFEGLSMSEQSEYLISSLEEAQTLPQEVGDMVRAWRSGDTGWFEREIASDLGRDPALYESVLAARNRRWIPKIEALLGDDRNYLVIVGTGHLVGRASVLDLLRRDGVGATQR